MNDGKRQDPTDDQRSQLAWRIADQCLERMQAGEPVCFDSVIRSHSELMPELGERLNDLKLIEIAKRGMEGDTDIRETTRLPSGNLRVRCPHCHERMELADGAPAEEIVCPSCHSRFALAPSIDSHATPGQTIGHFQLICPLGRGGFGTVWKALDKELDRIVAVKIPRHSGLSPTDVELLLREARTAAQLRHPNIVSVHEVGRDGDTVYIVSDLAEGKPLSQWTEDEHPTCRQAVEVCSKIAQALHHAHEMGVVHRDLKPTNVIVGAEHEPHLLDFGLARRESGDVTLTSEGQVLGTPAYMAPEQARGDAHRAERRADIYSLGVILFELLVGELPFRGSVRMLLNQVVNEDAPSPRKLNSSVPRDLETICLKCLEKSPDKRYATARDVAAELNRFLRDEPIQARPITKLDRAARWCRRNPVVASLGGTLLALFVALAVAGPLVSLRQIALRKNAEDEQQRANRLAMEESELREEYRRHLYASDMRVALHAWDIGNVRQVLALLGRHESAGAFKDLRGFEWFYLWSQCRRSETTPTLDNVYNVTCMAFSHDGSLLATGCMDQSIRLWDVRTRQLQQTFRGHDGFVSAIAFSPDGTEIASGSGNGEIKRWDISGAKNPRMLTGHSDIVWGLAYLSDGSSLVSGGQDRSLRIWGLHSGSSEQLGELRDGQIWTVACSGMHVAVGVGSNAEMLNVESGQVLAKLEGHGLTVKDVAFSPNGDVLATGGEDQNVILWDARTGEQLRTMTGHKHGVMAIDFSSDGSLLASAGSHNTVKIWQVATGAEQDTLKGHGGAIWALAFSPDGRLLASGGCDQVVKLWDAESLRDVPPARRLTAGKSAALSPNGHIVAVATEDRLTFHDLQSGRVEREVPIPAGITSSMPQSMAFSPTGKLLATACFDGTIRLLQLPDGKVVADFRTDDAPLWAIAFSPDGTKLAASGLETITLWSLPSGDLLGKLQGHQTVVRSLAFSPDGSRLASGSLDLTARIWDVNNQECERTLGNFAGAVWAVTFSRDGKTLVTASADSRVRFWEADTGREMADRRREVDWVWSVSYSPDGETLFLASQDKTVYVMAADTGEIRGQLTGHNDTVTSLEVSPDGKTLMSTSSDNEVLIWQAASKEAVDGADTRYSSRL